MAKKRAGLKLTPALKTRICREVALGKSLRRVLKEQGMPSMGRVMEVLGNDASWAEQYARARQHGIELHIDGIIELADKANAENAQAMRLKVDTRKWVASKILPKIYGDRLELQADVNVTGTARQEAKPLEQWTRDERLDWMRRTVFLLAQAGRELRDTWGLEELAEGYGFLGTETWRQVLAAIDGRKAPAAKPAALLPAPPARIVEREINPIRQADQ